MVENEWTAMAGFYEPSTTWSLTFIKPYEIVAVGNKCRTNDWNKPYPAIRKTNFLIFHFRQDWQSLRITPNSFLYQTKVESVIEAGSARRVKPGAEEFTSSK